MEELRISQEALNIGELAELSELNELTASGEFSSTANISPSLSPSAERETGASENSTTLQEIHYIENLPQPPKTQAPMRRQGKENPPRVAGKRKTAASHAATHSKTADQHHPQMIDEDVEGFASRLDVTLLNFRAESLKEFMAIKRHVLAEQAHRICEEKRKCDAMLGCSENQIEGLKEELATASKRVTDLGVQREVLSVWVSKFRMMHSVGKVVGKCFGKWKRFHRGKRMDKLLLGMKGREVGRELMKKAMEGWLKHYKVYKGKKNEQLFMERLQNEKDQMSIEYGKEIENLRQQVEESRFLLDQSNTQKVMIQENMKKAFMRGVCAMNFEAMSIVNPDANTSATNLEENTNTPQRTGCTENFFNMEEVENSLNINSLDSSSQSFQREEYPIQTLPIPISMYEGKSESKDHLWKPAPIFNHEISGGHINKPITITHDNPNRVIVNRTGIDGRSSLVSANKGINHIGYDDIEEEIKCNRRDPPEPTPGIITGSMCTPQHEEGRVIRVNQAEKAKVEVSSTSPISKSKKGVRKVPAGKPIVGGQGKGRKSVASNSSKVK